MNFLFFDYSLNCEDNMEDAFSYFNENNILDVFIGTYDQFLNFLNQNPNYSIA